MSWKVYVHYEDDHLEHTALIRCSPSGSVKHIVSEFTRSITKKFPGVAIDENQYQLSHSNGKAINTSLTIAQASIVPKEDLFVTSKKSASSKKRIPTEEEQQNAEKLKQQGNAQMAKKAYSKAVQYYSEAIALVQDNAILFSNRSQAFLNLKRYEEALDDSKQAIKLDSNFTKAYMRAGKAALQLKEYSAAKKFFVGGYDIASRKDDKLSKAMSKEFQKLTQECDSALQKNSESEERQKAVIEELQRSIEQIRDLFSRGKFKQTCEICQQVLQVVPAEKLSSHYLSTILLAAKKYKRVVSILEPAVKAHPDELELRITLAEAYYHTGDHMAAIKLLTGIEKLLTNESDQERVTVRVARHLIKTGQEDTAAQLIMGILRKNENNAEALVEYGNLIMSKGVTREAIKIYLRALILRSEDKVVRRKISQAVSMPGGVNALLEDLDDANSASALGFLALNFKDFGALNESEILFEKAALVAPSSATYTLNYVHVLEIQVKYQQGIDFMKKFLSENPSVSLPRVDEGALTCKEILKEIESLGDIFVSLKERNASEESVTAIEGVYFPQKETVAHNFTSDELDLLALLFTLVKILFVSGNLKIVAELVRLIETVRNGKELHLTSIRNEHAYYCCIAQLLPTIRWPLVGYKPLYVIGDSHTLPTAWHTVTIRDEKRLTIPKLVTGCKMWHLRPESFFFTKNNFYNMIDTIPEGSETVFLFGEIDCREGILVAVEKCKYENVEEGIAHTIDIYLEALSGVVEKKNLRIYIHPVVPVLNETRQMVKQFNEVLENKVRGSNGKFMWLDFFSSLLSGDSTQLRSEYALDGTHMNPSYLRLMESAISKYPL